MSFKTTTAIDQWRSELFESANFTTEQLDELQSHLHDELDSMSGLKISEQERFLLATHRIGSQATLTEAYQDAGKRSIFNFQRFSSIGQALLFYLTFMQLVQLCTSFTSHLVATVNPSMTAILFFYWGSQVIGLGLLGLLYWKVNRMSNKEGQLAKANLLSMALFCGILIFTVGYAYLSPFGLVFTNPMILNIIPNTLIIAVFFILSAMTVKNLRRYKQKLVLG